MSSDQPPAANRREFLTGTALRQSVAHAGEQFAAELLAGEPPSRGPALLLRTTAMACDFDVLLNPNGPANQVELASTALDRVHELESLLSVYRPDSELSRLNDLACAGFQSVSNDVYRLLLRATELSRLTKGAFNPVVGELIDYWQRCRREECSPSTDAIKAIVTRIGQQSVRFDEQHTKVAISNKESRLNLGAIGKGYAVDAAADVMRSGGVQEFLIHGGKSSVVAAGSHAGHDGWPIGLHNPLLPDRLLVTILLKDAALATSGTAVQWFRLGGKRYGHLLDPRTGWPVETMLSVSVIAPDAALADALSTAFFVLGVEKALECCDNFPAVGVILFPYPSHGQTLEPVVHNVPRERLFWEQPAALRMRSSDSQATEAEG